MPHQAKILQLTLVTMLLHFSTAAVEINGDEFSSAPVTQVVAVGLTSWRARGVTECALTCKSAAASSCSAFAFVAANRTCAASAVWNADFSAAAPGSEVFRKQVNETYFRNVVVQIGNRVFRVIQQRSKGILSFARNWTEYENGFGDDTDFWLGLKSINSLTASIPRVFRMEAVTWAGLLYFSEYSGFSLRYASTFYTMTLSAYLSGSSNTNSDSLTYHNGAKFSTIDKDNSGNNCAVVHDGGGGGWYKLCALANPSGIYRTSAVSNGESNMFWYGADGTNALKSVRLMLQIY